ncbi:MAG: transposase [Acidimicrobiales bacterium]
MLDLVAVGRTSVDLARDLGVAEHTIYTWRAPETASTADSKRAYRQEEREELTAATRQVRELEAEVEIHRHASPTREGTVYCAVVLDVFSRRVVGWSIDASPMAALVTNALDCHRLGDRRTPARWDRHPTDQGAQFTSWAFTRRALDSNLMPSMG